MFVLELSSNVGSPELLGSKGKLITGSRSVPSFFSVSDGKTFWSIGLMEVQTRFVPRLLGSVVERSSHPPRRRPSFFDNDLVDFHRYVTVRVASEVITPPA